ncbi:MAG TPA: hypothetical protein DCE44_13800 [Verrucomicrobiales bacterium]|nr:hypothetical protein [Verrucomicrobiales bacterium]
MSPADILQVVAMLRRDSAAFTDRLANCPPGPRQASLKERRAERAIWASRLEFFADDLERALAPTGRPMK